MTDHPVQHAIEGDWKAELETWKKERAEGLKGEYSWFSVTGLFWLSEGKNQVGTDPEAKVRLPRGPEHAATIRVDGLEAQLVPVKGSGLEVNGEVATAEQMIRPDSADDGPDKLTLDKMQLYLIERDDRLAVRLKDPESEARKAFTTLDYFEPSEKWRVSAELEPYEEPEEVDVSTILETTEKMMVVGKLHFEVDGQKYALEAFQVEDDDREYFIIFRDQTAGKETYGLGRYLYAHFGKDSRVHLDFNRAYNPPCAFTDYATCPLPRPSNILPVRIEAGELAFKGKRAGLQDH